MKIPGLSTIWKWLAAIGAFASAILFALLERAKKLREKDKRKVAEHAQKVQGKATDAMVDGLKKEGEVDDNPNKSHFEN